MSLLGEKKRRRVFLVAASSVLVTVILGLAVQALLQSNEIESERVTPPTDTQARSLSLEDRSASPPDLSNEPVGMDSTSTQPASAERTEVIAPIETTEIVPIPVPGRLASWFEDNEHLSKAHAQLEAEPREPVWATFNETRIASFLGDNLDSGDYEILSLQCRTQTCEVLVVGYGELIDGGPRNTAVDSFYGSVLPGIVEAAWSSFTGANVAFEPFASGAVGIQFMLNESEAAEPSQGLNDDSGNSVVGDSTTGSGEGVQSESGFFEPIPIADDLAGLIERNNEWSEFHQSLEREPDNSSWSTFMEGQIAEFLDTRPSLAGHSLLLAECRTSSCEIQLVVPYSDPGPWQLDLTAIDRQPWFEFESWEMNGNSASPESMTVILRLDGEP